MDVYCSDLKGEQVGSRRFIKNVCIYIALPHAYRATKQEQLILLFYRNDQYVHNVNFACRDEMTSTYTIIKNTKPVGREGERDRNKLKHKEK